MKTKSLFLGLLTLGMMCGAGTPAHAAVVCTNLSYNLTYGSRDGSTRGEVTELQTYLNSRGYLVVSPTGYFGSLTLAAAKSFQRDNGIITTGYVGPITRAKIVSLACGTNPPQSQVSIASMTPRVGPVGTVVTVTGQGFTADSVIHFGPGAFGYFTFIDARTLQFTVPNAVGPYCKPGTPCPMYMARLTVPGTYAVSVSNDSGVSNSIDFSVTDPSNVFSINGVDAPSTLPVTSTGTWTVRVNNPGTSALHYSVTWGDESMVANTASIMAPPSSTTQSSATFTHAYRATGTFAPTFTVTDDNGHSATVSASVLVTPIY